MNQIPKIPAAYQYGGKTTPQWSDCGYRVK
jgi:hypothetical protein